MAALAGGAAPTAAFATKGAVIAGSVLVVTAAFALLRTTGGERGPSPAVPETVAAAEEPRTRTPEVEALAPPEIREEASRDAVPPREIEAAPRTRVPETEPAGAAAPAAPNEQIPFLLRGRVLFPNGGGVPDATVVLGPWRTTTGSSGTFALEIEREALAGQSYRPGQETVRAGLGPRRDSARLGPPPSCPASGDASSRAQRAERARPLRSSSSSRVRPGASPGPSSTARARRRPVGGCRCSTPSPSSTACIVP